jgi:hypothetical protein
MVMGITLLTIAILINFLAALLNINAYKEVNENGYGFLFLLCCNISAILMAIFILQGGCLR